MWLNRTLSEFIFSAWESSPVFQMVQGTGNPADLRIFILRHF
jgi:hypothetical protein